MKGPLSFIRKKKHIYKEAEKIFKNVDQKKENIEKEQQMQLKEFNKAKARY